MPATVLHTQTENSSFRLVDQRVSHLFARGEQSPHLGVFFAIERCVLCRREQFGVQRQGQNDKKTLFKYLCLNWQESQAFRPRLCGKACVFD